MAIYRLDKIIKDVRIAMDHNMQSDTLISIGDVDTLALDEIIKSKIVDAVKQIHASAPAYLLEYMHSFGDTGIQWDDDNVCGYIILPDDCMRVVVFEMDDWERPVFTPITADSPEYTKQSSRFRGIRGSVQKPICVIAIRPEGRVLEFYSCKTTDAMIARAVYIPYPEIETEIDEITGAKNYGIEISEKCYKSVIHMIASLVAYTLGDIEKGSTMAELSKSLLI